MEDRHLCSILCPYCVLCQEDYDDESMAYCTRSPDMVTWTRKFLGSAAEVREGSVNCLY